MWWIRINIEQKENWATIAEGNAWNVSVTKNVVSERKT